MERYIKEYADLLIALDYLNDQFDPVISLKELRTLISVPQKV